MNGNEFYEGYDKLPWIVFKLNNSNYAVNGHLVTSILDLPKEITTVPNSPEYIKGVVNVRGEILPLVELRNLFSIKSIPQEFIEFKDMIDRRKNDHIHWVTELKKCISKDDFSEFNLASDPHKCKLGRWYDNFQTDNNFIKFELKKMEEPHFKLHGMLELAKSCSRDCENCQRQECLKSTLEKSLDSLQTQILKILDNTKHVFKSHFKEMIVTIQNDNMHIGIIVDEIIGIQNLNCTYYPYGIDSLHGSKFVMGTADNDKSKDLILLLNDKSITNLVPDIDTQID